MLPLIGTDDMVSASAPTAADASTIVTANVPITVFAAGSILNVADVYNPPSAPGVLYLDIVTTADPSNSTSLPLAPGGSYRISKPITTACTAVSAYSAHQFCAVRY